MIEKRKNVMWKQNPSQEQVLKKGNRTRLNQLLRKCEQLLHILGLSCVQSPGEAEAFCAYLNQHELVDGCISQDGDCFLYGAKTVYRNFTIASSGSGSNAGFSIDVYQMSCIEKRLMLGRNELIAISLLCGCDYNETGVKGIGKETVLAFLSGIKDENVLERMQRWRCNPYFDDLENQRSMIAKKELCEMCYHKGCKRTHQKTGCSECGAIQGCQQDLKHPFSNRSSNAELQIRRKAVIDPEFPSDKIIDEFLLTNVEFENVTIDTSWRKPDLNAFMSFASVYLGWTNTYTLTKFLPLMTRWQLTELDKEKENGSQYPKVNLFFEPEFIVKKKILKGIKSFEVQWSDVVGEIKSIDPDILLRTIEPEYLFERIYPELVKKYFVKHDKGSKGRKTKNGMKKRVDLKNKALHNQMKIDSYFKEHGCEIRHNEEEENIVDKPCYDKNGSHATLKNENLCNMSVDESSSSMSYKNEIREDEDADACHITSTSNLTSASSHSKTFCKYRRNENERENTCKTFHEDCSICCNDDIDDVNLSAIINTIVGQCSPSEKTSPISAFSHSCDGQEMNSEANESFDEFDKMMVEEYVPLIERIKLNQ